MLAEKAPKTCLSCGKPVKGRSDKKFCDDYCLIRNVNNALGKNRRILESFLPEGDATAKASRDKLLEKGFQFKYHTHLYTTKTNKVYYYCYEYGYLPLEHNWYLIVKRAEE
jgi:predicted nucleic acid-binding Zn ribbon protein